LLKSFNTKSLSKGEIQDPSLVSQNYDIGTYSTGDNSTLVVDLSDMSFKIISKSTTGLTRSSIGAPVLRFSISPENNSNLKMIDFIVITCNRNGQTSLCGVCNVESTGNVVFVDYTNTDYVGNIAYKASIVLTTGKKLSKVPICNSMLFELYPRRRKKG